MRLRAEGDLRPEQVQLALPHRCVDDRDAALQIALAVRPAAAQRRRAVEPCDRPARPSSPRPAPSRNDRAVVEEHVHRIRHALRDRRGGVDRDAQDRAGHVELLRRQRPGGPVRGALDEVVLHRQLEELRQSSSTIARPRRTVPPSSRNFLSCGAWSAPRCSAPQLALDTCAGIELWPPAHRRHAAAAAPAARRAATSAGRRRPNPDGKMITSYLLDRLPASSACGKDDLERELELLEDPARPARRHRAAVLVGERDPNLPQLDRVARRPSGDTFEVDAEIGRELLDSRRGRRPSRRRRTRPAAVRDDIQDTSSPACDAGG